MLPHTLLPVTLFRLDGMVFQVCLWPRPALRTLASSRTACSVGELDSRGDFVCLLLFPGLSYYLSSFFVDCPEFLLRPYSLVVIWSLNVITESAPDLLPNKLFLEFLADFSRFGLFFTISGYILEGNVNFVVLRNTEISFSAIQLFFDGHLVSFRRPLLFQTVFGDSMNL